MNKDLEHLKILSICHYVLAGLCVFPMIYGLIYMAFGLFFGAMLANAPNTKDGPPPALFSGIFIGIGAIIFIFALTFGLLLFKSGRNLKANTSYTFCLVIAGISCIFVPFGTILGVFTLVVLLRDSVKQIFNGEVPTNYSPQNWQQ
jgi:hypothetical protein